MGRWGDEEPAAESDGNTDSSDSNSDEENSVETLEEEMTPAKEKQPIERNNPIMLESILAKDPAADDLAQRFQNNSNLTRLRQNTEKFISSIAPPAPGEPLVLQKKSATAY